MRPSHQLATMHALHCQKKHRMDVTSCKMTFASGDDMFYTHAEDVPAVCPATDDPVASSVHNNAAAALVLPALALRGAATTFGASAVEAGSGLAFAETMAGFLSLPLMSAALVLLTPSSTGDDGWSPQAPGTPPEPPPEKSGPSEFGPVIGAYLLSRTLQHDTTPQDFNGAADPGRIEVGFRGVNGERLPQRGFLPPQDLPPHGFIAVTHPQPQVPADPDRAVASGDGGSSGRGSPGEESPQAEEERRQCLPEDGAPAASGGAGGRWRLGAMVEAFEEYAAPDAGRDLSKGHRPVARDFLQWAISTGRLQPGDEIELPRLAGLIGMSLPALKSTIADAVHDGALLPAGTQGRYPKVAPGAVEALQAVQATRVAHAQALPQALELYQQTDAYRESTRPGANRLGAVRAFLHWAILEGHLKPGDLLDSATLGEPFGVDKTNLHPAFSRLDPHGSIFEGGRGQTRVVAENAAHNLRQLDEALSSGTRAALEAYRGAGLLSVPQGLGRQLALQRFVKWAIEERRLQPGDLLHTPSVEKAFHLEGGVAIALGIFKHAGVIESAPTKVQGFTISADAREHLAKVESVARGPRADAIAGFFREGIADGTLAPGQAAPGVAELMERFGVSESAAGMVVRQLRAQGLLLQSDREGAVTIAHDAVERLAQLGQPPAPPVPFRAVDPSLHGRQKNAWVQREIVRVIMSGELANGMLPPREELARAYGYSVSGLHEIFERLARSGYLVSHATGTFVAPGIGPKPPAEADGADEAAALSSEEARWRELFQPIDFRTKGSVVDLAFNEIRRGIGQLRPGERIPTDTWLAARLGVAGSTVFSVLQQLHGAGLVSRKVGQGTHLALPSDSMQQAELRLRQAFDAQRLKPRVPFSIDEVSAEFGLTPQQVKAAATRLPPEMGVVFYPSGTKAPADGRETLGSPLAVRPFETLSEAASRRIEQSIRSGELAYGDLVSMAGLATSWNLGQDALVPAFRQLQRAGLIEQVRNGYAVAMPTEQASDIGVRRQSVVSGADRRQAIAADMRNAIATQRLPAGEALSLKSLAKAFNASRDDIMQVTRALREEGLLTSRQTPQGVGVAIVSSPGEAKAPAPASGHPPTADDTASLARPEEDVASPSWEAVKDKVLAYYTRQDLGAEDKLDVSQAASDLDLSEYAVDLALRALSDDGLVLRYVGKGSYLTAPRETLAWGAPEPVARAIVPPTGQYFYKAIAAYIATEVEAQRLKPGDRISTDQLVSNLGASKAVVEGGLRYLVGLGVLGSDKGGFRVRDPSALR